MPQSSLVFVVIVAAWILVLLPLWVAHREESSQARLDDRDSEHLRLLSLRTPTPAPSSARSSAPLLTRQPSAPVTAEGEDDDQMQDSYPSAGGPLMYATDSQRGAAARRAKVLKVLLAFTAVSWALVALPFLSWWVAVPATVLLVADLTALVVTARARAKRARFVATMTPARAERRLTTPVARERADSAPDAAPVTGPSWTQLMASTGEPTPLAEPQPVATWTPRPVPRPTYMLKPVVERAEQEVPADLPGVVPAAVEPSSPPVLTIVGAPMAEPTKPAEVVAEAKAEDDKPLRPWERDHTWADDLDMMLARRRAVGS